MRKCKTCVGSMMEFKVGDRVITNGLVKGTIISIMNHVHRGRNLNSVKFDHLDMELNLWDNEISLDIQYYREERLKQILYGV